MDPLDTPTPIHNARHRVDECLRGIRSVLEDPSLDRTRELEEEWKKCGGFRHAHFVSSAAAGMHLAVRALKEVRRWKEGAEVVTAPLAPVWTNQPLLHERLTPVFADADEYLCLDVESVKARITDRTVAVLFAGLGGSVGRLREISYVCLARGLALILDATHMAGTRIEGRHVGGEANAAVFGFDSVSTTSADGGAMLTVWDERLDAHARKLSRLGVATDPRALVPSALSGYFSRHYDVGHIGFMYRPHPVVAELGLVELKYLDKDRERFREIASAYDAALTGQSGIAPVPVPPGCESSRNPYVVLARRRDELMDALRSMGIEAAIPYRYVATDPMFRWAAGDDTPRARTAAPRLMALPLHSQLDARDVERVAQALARFSPDVAA